MTSFIFHALIILVSFWKIFADTKCDGKDGVICCFGYTWNEADKKCSKCDPGFFGVNCSKSCPYPNYGEKCKHRCLCNPESCDHMVGCVKKTDQIYVSSGRVTSFVSAKSSIWSSFVTAQGHRITTQRTGRIERTSFVNFTVSKMHRRGTETFSQISTEAMVYSKNIEGKLEVLMTQYEKDRQFFGVMQKLQIGMTITIIFVLIMMVCRFTRKKSCKYRRPQNKTAAIQSLDEEDHYHHVEDIHHILRLNNAEGFLFNGLAEVKFNYNEEQNRYTIGFQPPRDHKEVDDKPQQIPRHTNMQGNTTYYDDPEITGENDGDFDEVEKNSFQDQLNLHEQCGYLESVPSLQKGDACINPYLSVIS